MKFELFGRTSTVAVLSAVAAMGASQAYAQGAEGEVSEVVVTGSFIAGTPEDAALPVDVPTSH